MSSAVVTTGTDLGVCAGVIHLCQQHAIPCAFFVPHEDPLAQENRLEVGFVRHLLLPHLVVPRQHRSVDALFLEGEKLKHARVVCPPEDKVLMNLCLDMLPSHVYLTPAQRNALRRDAQMVQETDTVYVIGQLFRRTTPKPEPMGGHSWIHHVALRMHKPLYFYDLSELRWFSFNYLHQQFTPCTEPAPLQGHCLVAGTKRFKRDDPAFHQVLEPLLLTAKW